MRKFALALAAAATLGLAAPAFAGNVTTTFAPSVKVAQADVTVRVKPGKRVKIVRHSHARAQYRGWHRHGCRIVTVRTMHHGHVHVKNVRRCR